MNLTEAKAFSLEKWFNPAYGADQITYNGTAIYGHVIYGGTGKSISRHATIIVMVSDVEDPQHRDTVVIGGTTWRVFRDSGNTAIKGDGQTWEIPIYREEKSRIK